MSRPQKSILSDELESVRKAAMEKYVARARARFIERELQVCNGVGSGDSGDLPEDGGVRDNL